MACKCPGCSQSPPNQSTTVCSTTGSDMAVEVMPSDSVSNMPAVQATTTNVKLTCAQQIAKLKEKMDDEAQWEVNGPRSVEVDQVRFN